MPSCQNQLQCICLLNVPKNSSAELLREKSAWFHSITAEVFATTDVGRIAMHVVLRELLSESRRNIYCDIIIHKVEESMFIHEMSRAECNEAL